MGLRNFFKGIFAKKHKRLALALGSGGAKGMAHIGVLKAFEENGIKFDMVAGTSIGSIVGGLYAGGHDTSEMFGFLKEYDITNPKTLLVMKIRGMTVESVLDGALGGMHIEDLDMPFYAVACDINSGEEVVMTGGNLANAMACSSAIPPVFKPVGRENRKLIDGAFVNAVPGDVLKEHGADFVISVSLTEEEDATNAKSKEVIDKMYRGNGVPECDRLSKGISASDFVIKPNLKRFNAASISNLDEMYQEGYRAATEAMPEILKLLEENKIIDKKHRKN